MKHIKFYLTMILSTMLVLIGVIAEGAITSGQPISGNYMTGMKSVDNENLIINPTPYKTDTGITAGTGMTIVRSTATSAFRFQNQAYWSVQSSTQGACRTFDKRTPYGPLLNGQCMAGLMFNGDAKGYSIRIENSTGGILTETPLDFVSGYTKAFTSGVTCGDNSERVVKICRTASGAGATIGVGDVFYGAYQAPLAPAITEWKDVSGFSSASMTNTSIAYAKYRQVGDTAEFNVRVNVTGAPTGNLILTMPSSFPVDTLKVQAINIIGNALGTDTGTGEYHGAVYWAGGSSVRIIGPNNQGAWNHGIPFTWASGDYVNIKFALPIQGWSAGAQLTNQFGGDPIVFRSIGTGTNPTLTASTYTPIALSNVQVDTATGYNTPQNRYDVKSRGYYRLKAALTFSNNVANGFHSTSIAVNGAGVTESWSPSSTNSNYHTVDAEIIRFLEVGDNVLVRAYSSLTGTSVIQGASNLSVEKISPPNYAIPFKKAPTVTRLTSGSGTYTVPQGVLYLSIEMVGGGSGGAGGGATQPAGGAGGNTTFGTSLLTATGAGASSSSGGPGGTATVNAPAITVANVIGARGQAGFANSGAVPYASGGIGASSSFGGAGTNWPAAGGVGANANTGSGGGGGSGGNAATHIGGGGGGAGGYLRAIIPTPDASYPYVVGAGGTAGPAGTSGYVGSTGGAGVINITEHYQ